MNQGNNWANWHFHPENSLAGVQGAIDDIDVIEIDVRKSKDGEFFLMHDSTLDRTTNGAGTATNYKSQQMVQRLGKPISG